MKPELQNVLTIVSDSIVKFNEKMLFNGKHFNHDDCRCVVPFMYYDLLVNNYNYLESLGVPLPINIENGDMSMFKIPVKIGYEFTICIYHVSYTMLLNDNLIYKKALDIPVVTNPLGVGSLGSINGINGGIRTRLDYLRTSKDNYRMN